MRRGLIVASLLLVVALAALAWWRHVPAPQRGEFFVFGSTTRVELRGVDAQRAADVLGRIGALLQRDQREWHPWEISDLMRLNAALARGEAYTVPEGLAGLIRRAKEAYTRSDGLFDPALGALIDLWGYHTSSYPLTSPMPDMDLAQRLAAAHPGMDDIEIDASGSVRAKNPAIQLDLNGLAEGYAAEQIAQLLAAAHIGDAIVSVGGDVLALGSADGRPWRVAIQSPDQGVLAHAELSGHEALFSSGDYNKFREVKGQRWAHILDPRTGQPIHGVAAATVLHPDAVVADAAATALMIAGPQDLVRIARRMGTPCALVLTDDGDLYLTPAMQRRLQMHQAPKALHVVDDLGANCAP